MLSPLLARLKPHKQRIARLIGLGGMLLVASLLIRGAPREVEVELMLGPQHRQFVEVRVAYVQQGEEVHGVAFSFPDGAPGELHHSVQLPAGEFEVHTELRPLHGAVLASIGRLHAPNDGPVVIRVPTDPP
ncbi:MAG TPA: hypothetical protein VFN67_22745 [Polyangiales bacterium]|jgi:hypothetical protein|nr:hypothetical protein [Polyangiales bacterium]